MTRAIDVRGLNRRFGSTRVLRGLDLTVDDEEHVAIAGANGSGKTTLLRVLAGVLRPTSGDVEVLGRTATDPDARRRIGVIAHSPGLYPRLTAAENVAFWARMYDARDGAERGRDVLAQLGLDANDPRPVAAYSRGMQQRVAVAGALCAAPLVVLADEPLAGLDDAGAESVIALLRAIPTVVIATHDGAAFDTARQLRLLDGRLQPV